MTLLAEDLLLLLLDDEKGSLAATDKVGVALGGAILAELALAGAVTSEWPAVDSSHEREVRGALTACLVQGQEPDVRTAALVALLSAIGHAHRVVDTQGLSSGEVRRRSKQVAEGDWAAKAVKDAVQAAAAALATVAAAGAAGSGAS